jgi:hypothetical protein
VVWVDRPTRVNLGSVCLKGERNLEPVNNLAQRFEIYPTIITSLKLADCNQQF